MTDEGIVDIAKDMIKNSKGTNSTTSMTFDKTKTAFMKAGEYRLVNELIMLGQIYELLQEVLVSRVEGAAPSSVMQDVLAELKLMNAQNKEAYNDMYRELREIKVRINDLNK